MLHQTLFQAVLEWLPELDLHRLQLMFGPEQETSGKKQLLYCFGEFVSPDRDRRDQRIRDLYLLPPVLPYEAGLLEHPY